MVMYQINMVKIIKHHKHNNKNIIINIYVSILPIQYAVLQIILEWW